MTQPASIRFTDLKLIDPLLQALETEGYVTPTPIQQQAIPRILEHRDLLGCAQTGTGKTAAFGLPILQLLAEHPAAAAGVRRPIRCLVLTPTRELAAQIGESFDRYGARLGLTNTVIFGGVGQGPQVSDLRKGIDILVATPGRLLDLIEQRFVDLTQIQIFVLDEADRMLDMGFVHDVKRVIRLLPKQRHSLFFSATMPPDIQRLANEILTNPVKVEVTPIATTAEKIQQAVYHVESHDKRRLLEHVMLDPNIARALVFTRTKHGADKVAKFLNQAEVPAEAIHGNKSQNNRTRALNNFKEGTSRVLVATDIAARGIDIDGVTHVINYELPNIPESYVHRIGRTARAGAEGIALSFCDREEMSYLRDIERLIRMRVTVIPTPPLLPPRAEAPRPPREHGHGGGRGGHGGGGRGGQRGSGQRGDGQRGGRIDNGGRRPMGDGRRPPQAGPAPMRAEPHRRQNEAHTSSMPRADRGPRHQGPRGGGQGHRGGGGRGPNGPSRSSSSGPRQSSAGPRTESRENRPAASAPAPAVKKPWWKKLIADS